MRFLHRIAGFLGIAASVAASHPSPTPNVARALDLPRGMPPARMRKRGQGKSRNLKHAIRRKQIAAASRKRNWIN